MIFQSKYVGSMLLLNMQNPIVTTTTQGSINAKRPFFSPKLNIKTASLERGIFRFLPTIVYPLNSISLDPITDEIRT